VLSYTVYVKNTNTIKDNKKLQKGMLMRLSKLPVEKTNKKTHTLYAFK